MKDFLTERAESIAYLSGVLVGDGYLSKQMFRLKVADKDFAEAFCYALETAFKITKIPKINKNGYWVVTASNGYKRFNILNRFEAVNALEKKSMA